MRLLKWLSRPRRATVTDTVHLIQLQTDLLQGMVHTLVALHQRVKTLEATAEDKPMPDDEVLGQVRKE